jgi:hypothetical protein
LLSVSDEDRESKVNGIPKAFLQGRQDALDKYVKDAPEEFKQFLEDKQKGNRGMLEFYTGNPDVRLHFPLCCATQLRMISDTDAIDTIRKRLGRSTTPRQSKCGNRPVSSSAAYSRRR